MHSESFFIGTRAVPCHVRNKNVEHFGFPGRFLRKLSALRGRRLRSIFGSFGSLQELKQNFSSDSGNTEMYMAICNLICNVICPYIYLSFNVMYII